MRKNVRGKKKPNAFFPDVLDVQNRLGNHFSIHLTEDILRCSETKSNTKHKSLIKIRSFFHTYKCTIIQRVFLSST